MIVNDRITDYIHSLESSQGSLLDSIEQEALRDRVPIIRRETAALLRTLVAALRPARILEIGTAVGYSSLLMCRVMPENCRITTIEKYEKRIPAALEHFKKAGEEGRITLLAGDADDLLAGLKGQTFDLVFMDAAKGQYLHWLPMILELMPEGGVLISDNVLQDGDIVESRFAVERRNRTIHSRMRRYLYELKHRKGLETASHPHRRRSCCQHQIYGESGMRKTELLIPAGSLDVLKTAVVYGADAVYIGGEAFGLRAKAHNFSNEEMKQGIAFAHARGVKVYVTANILAHNGDLPGVEAYFEEMRDVAPDALIISDPGVFAIARRVLPHMEIHISTQANNTNYGTYLFWHGLGARRVVSARELSLAEIREIRDHIPQDMQIESFIHGAMCISYSGRCLLSNYFVGRDANQGACTHPCRWKYSLVEETRPGEYMPVYENERGTYIFNSKDLCMVEYIPEMMDAGIDSFKIEGRMKTALYVATVTRAYRRAIDDYLKDPAVYRENLEWYREEIGKCTNRRFTTGFYFGKPTADDHIYDSSTYVKSYTYLGTVEETDSLGRCRIQQKNKFSVGETIEVMKPDGQNLDSDSGVYDRRRGQCAGERSPSKADSVGKAVVRCVCL